MIDQRVLKLFVKYVLIIKKKKLDIFYRLNVPIVGYGIRLQMQ